MRWRHAIVHLFWGVIPALSALSAMRMLNYVTTAIFMPAFSKKVKRVYEGHGHYPKLELAGFFALRVLAAIVGLDAFLVKFRRVAPCAAAAGLDSQASRESLVSILMFLNQVLGVVQVGQFVQRRLYVFVFGGEDDDLEEEDELLLATWQAMLARRIR